VPPLHHRWLNHLVAAHKLSVEPIHDASGQLVAQPLFIVRTPAGTKACFAQMPDPTIVQSLRGLKIAAILPGDPVS
jgi:hypothetical protein